MKYCLVLVALCGGVFIGTAQAYRDRFDDSINRMFSHMEQQLEDMSKVNTYAHTVSVSEDGGAVRVSFAVDKTVAAKDVLVEVEDGVLHLVIELPERIELLVEERWLTLTAERRDSQNASSSFACASQQLTLPAVVDISTVKVDLTDGNLTFSFNKNAGKNRQRVVVTQGDTKKVVPAVAVPAVAVPAVAVPAVAAPDKKTGEK